MLVPALLVKLNQGFHVLAKIAALAKTNCPSWLAIMLGVSYCLATAAQSNRSKVVQYFPKN